MYFLVKGFLLHLKKYINEICAPSNRQGTHILMLQTIFHSYSIRILISIIFFDFELKKGGEN